MINVNFQKSMLECIRECLWTFIFSFVSNIATKNVLLSENFFSFECPTFRAKTPDIISGRILFHIVQTLKPIFHCDAKPFALGTGIGCPSQFCVTYTNMLVSKNARNDLC